MDFNNKFEKQWENEGTQPSDSFFESTGGFKAKLKPPAQYFNWFWHKVIAAITELQTKMSGSNIRNGSATGSLKSSGSNAEIAPGGNINHIGENAVQLGKACAAMCSNSVAVGKNVVIDVLGTESAGIGKFLSVIDPQQLVIGRYNATAFDVLQGVDLNLFVIGNGTGTSDRSNCFVVDEKGNVRARGDITAGITEVFGGYSLSKMYDNTLRFNVNMTIGASTTKTYDIGIGEISISDYLLLRLTDGGTVGVTTVNAYTTYFGYSKNSVSIKLTNGGKVIVSNSGSTDTALNIGFLLVKSKVLTLTEISS